MPLPPAHGGRPFPKGVSANPGGRCKAAGAIARMIRDRTDDGAELVEFALAVMRGRPPDPDPTGKRPTLVNVPDDPRSRMHALQWLSDRGLGKALEDIDIVINGSVDIRPQQQAMIEALKLSPHERRQRLVELGTKALAAPAPARELADDDS